MAWPERRRLPEFPRLRALLFALPLLLSVCGAVRARGGGGDLRRVVEVPGEPGSVVWAVQLSDLHLSVFHPDRAADFRRHVGDALAIVNPALVLITGDLTDGKSKDLLSSRQEKLEWIEYERVIDDVAYKSGLDKEIFYDLRGNHDSYGVPEVGGMFDFYNKHSINARLGRTGAVQSITLQNSGRKHLFVGFDSAMGVGLRSPTNLFGQPTDRLLSDLDAALSQWDNQSTSSQVTKIAFGHFPISFSALTTSGRSIRDVFLKHSLSAYLCGHLHTNFGRNLKRHHTSEQHRFSPKQYFQFDIHETMSTAVSNGNCSARTESVAEFWEWEMGDWRSARSMRILAIDSGHVSYADMDFRFGSRDVIIVPTFPLDSRFMQMSSDPFDFICQATRTAHLGTVRALVFSRYKIESVTMKVYESHSGSFHLVLEQEMERTSGKGARAAMYTVLWNWRDFLDDSPDRYWLQIEAVDMSGEVYLSELRPFSVNGLTAKVSWAWKEFRVMGCQWNQLYYPIMWTTLAFLFSFVLVPRTSFTFYENQIMLKFLRPKMTRRSSGSFAPVNFDFFAVELSKIYFVWSGMLLYLLYLVFFPWFTGYAVTENHNKMYLHYRGWSTKYLANTSTMPYIGLPDVMVIVLPHLLFVVLPAFLIIAAIAAERALYLGHDISQRAKKDDDHHKETRYTKYGIFHWFRKILILLCLPIVWKHWKVCFLFNFNSHTCNLKF
ncbi:putative metallophosphoesterase [Dichanthelium oligosanthes]|uniref:Putative metallophosphoesterase n=1 Tax=Dichanthelium oligosanthes TaxID=888268 RepID=A0A1E5UV58_9POAL|nr:putative metallophosphoesterase [Dichanthelium oligosanthes]